MYNFHIKFGFKISQRIILEFSLIFNYYFTEGPMNAKKEIGKINATNAKRKVTSEKIVQ